ncbi:nucleotidyl transferase AbiEii/AbiGii toxin family protein [Candidatus Sulfurimonas baltica]|uniref:Nucleotidyl transferase AbiEii/AbiGii toxin family protein n=1 Tax=Candidatus Sulfurimonas baltica TaxID=2740404 RepID=A0A7S7LWP1_9BACT|nr:nucleotidyl transferase AbiEii/AbiGii toxin family protein [Candidatus Sulfurimonas baltica]QOY51964.1 nucleotidyl transferase AbiEii/AbiGii toxin family protein [Candidatus Sulfurimonas baltica]
MKNIEFIQEHYNEQIHALNSFIKDVYQYLPNQDHSLIRFGGGTALAIYYFQHRLSFDIDLFVTDVQVLNYLSPKHWIEETSNFNNSKYIDLSNHIRVLEKKNNIKVDVLVTQDSSMDYLLDDSRAIFSSDVYVESIEDIIAKKIVYRRNDNLTRDIIDIAISIKHADNILEKLFIAEKINREDIQDLYNSIERLDRETFNEEIEIVAPFEKYIDDAKNAPEIISETCQKLLM